MRDGLHGVFRDDRVFQVAGCQALFCFKAKKEKLIFYPLYDSYGDFLGPPQIQVRRCGNTSYSCRKAS